jgi:hypothetical protein
MNPNIKSVIKRKREDEIKYKVGMWKKSEVRRNEDSTAWTTRMNRIESNIKIIYKDVVYGKVRQLKMNTSLHKCFIF